MNLEIKISSKSYIELAEVLDMIPNSFAHTEDEIHLKLLKKIFSPEEAFIASKLKLTGITKEDLASIIHLPDIKTVKILESMNKKGQIRAWTRKDGVRKYGLMPFVVGIYEEQLDKMDKELAGLIEEFLEKSKAKGLFDTEPAIFKVIPINKEIKTELEIFPYENAESMINDAKSWGIRKCICKIQQEHLGNPCSFPSTVCLNFSQKENAFDNHEITKPISKDEALKYLWQAEEAGLIHCSMNVKEGHNYICNCCTCCCGILKGLTKHKQPHAFVNSNYQAHVDETECIGCEICLDRCQFDALSMYDEICNVNTDKCVGCGVCTISCDQDALHLISRDSTQITDPPETQREWMTQKAISRNVDPSDIL